METVSIIIALVLSIILHEVAHGYAADRLGDPTARMAGRLSLNPFVHIDPVGSVLVPALLFISNAGFLFGWAKPVPYNPYNLRNQRWGDAAVAAAGPAANLLIALIFSALIRLSPALSLSAGVVDLSGYIVYINILLALFNSIPIPPLDGSKMLMALLPREAAFRYREWMMRAQQWGLLVTFVFIFIFINLFWGPFSQLVAWVFTLFTGIPAA
jgi:Zn-dependent protease